MYLFSKTGSRVGEKTSSLPLLVPLALLLLLFILAACNPAADFAKEPVETATTTITGTATVDKIDVMLMESLPVQVNVVATGILPDDCTTIGSITTTRVDNNYIVTINTVRPAVGVCNGIEEPFEETIPLDTDDIPAGRYNVTVNDVKSGFELTVDHEFTVVSPGSASTPVAISADGTQAALAAQALLAEELGVETEAIEIGQVKPVEWPDGCLGLPQEGEACAQQVTPGFEITLKHGDDVYIYRSDVSGQIVRLQTEPEAAAKETATPAPCKNRAQFVRDVTVRDGARSPANKEFVKTWRLANVGTCTWTTDYEVVFVGGDQMSGPDAQPLETEVPPGKKVDISVKLVAPSEKGTYKGEWALKSPESEIFGLGNRGKQPFWLQIVVPKSGPTPTVSPEVTLKGFLWHDLCAPGAEGEPQPASPPSGCTEADDGTYVADGIYQKGEPRIGGTEVTLGKGQCPSSGMAIAIADAQGQFSFAGLKPGTYCVAIDPLSQHNSLILIPGVWTYPPGSNGMQTVKAEAGEVISDVNFGWDYQFAP